MSFSSSQYKKMWKRRKNIQSPYIGMEWKEANILAQKNGKSIRPIKKVGEKAGARTLDFRFNRINVEIDNNDIVTKILGAG